MNLDLSKMCSGSTKVLSHKELLFRTSVRIFWVPFECPFVINCIFLIVCNILDLQFQCHSTRRKVVSDSDSVLNEYCAKQKWTKLDEKWKQKQKKKKQPVYPQGVEMEEVVEGSGGRHYQQVLDVPYGPLKHGEYVKVCDA